MRTLLFAVVLGLASCAADPLEYRADEPTPDAGLADLAGNGCLAEGKHPPAVCSEHSDDLTQAVAVVCQNPAGMDPCQSIWLSATGDLGVFYPEEICRWLGYSRVGRSGGTSGRVCGTIADKLGTTSCQSPGHRDFDYVTHSHANGHIPCDSSQFPQAAVDSGIDLRYCGTVMWECLHDPFAPY